MNKDKLKEYLEILFFIIIVGGIVISSSFTALTIGRGLEQSDYLTKVTFYWGMASLGLLVFCALKLVKELTRNNYKKYGAFWGFLDDREDSIFKNIKILRSPLLLTIICIVVFGLFMSYNIILQNTIFTGSPIVAEQVTETGKILLASEPAVSGENLFFISLAILLFSGIMWLLRIKGKIKWNATYDILLCFIVSIALGYLGMQYHSFRYGANQGNLNYVFLFWMLLTFICLMLRSIIPIWVGHYLNNILLEAKTLFVKESLFAYSIIIILFIGFLGFLYWYFFYRKRG